MTYQGHPDQHFGHVTYSQSGEDLVILNLFKQLKIDLPSYLDLGAHHPETISNTALLYSRGCRGINVEANPNLAHIFPQYRPLDITVNVGIIPEHKSGLTHLEFYMFDATSGRNTLSFEEAVRFEHESGMKVKKTIQIPVMTLNQLVNKYCNGQFPHFLNCDLEGLDYEVLASADFSRSAPSIICVETRAENSYNMDMMMRTKGYAPYCRLGENNIFAHQSLFLL